MADSSIDLATQSPRPQLDDPMMPKRPWRATRDAQPAPQAPSQLDPVAQYNAEAAARRASTSDAAAAYNPQDDDQRLKAAIHLDTAKAIAAAMHVITGSDSDGSDSRLDDLTVPTLSALFLAIERHIDEAQKLEREIDKRCIARLKRRQAEVAHG